MSLLRMAGMAALLALAILAAGAQQGPITLAYSDTDVAQVLRSIGVKTGASIVYSSPKNEKAPITLNVEAGSVEEAIRAVSAAAGLVYRKVEKTYVVAKPDAIRQALAPYSYKVTFSPTGDVGDAAKMLMEALPMATISVVGDKIYFAGIMEDVSAARRLLKTQATRERSVTQVVNLQYVDSKAVSSMISATFPTVRVSSVEAKSGGPSSLVLTGPLSDVEAAKATASQVDVPSANVRIGPTTYKIYHIKYSSAPSLIDFMKTAAPEIDCFAGPEVYSPLSAAFKPLSLAAQSQTASGSSGGGGGGGGASQSGGYFPVDPGRDPYKPLDRAKLLVIRGTDRSVNEAIRLLEQVDIKPKQVAIQIRVVDTSPDVTEKLGFSWDWTRFGFYELVPGTQVTITGSTAAEATQFTTKNVGFGQFSRVPWTFETFLQAAKTKAETKVIASPNLMVTDNDQGQVFVGDTLRVQLSATGALGSITTSVQEFPIGIIMLLRPRVNDDRTITLRVHPVVSSLTSVNTAGLPQTSEREADTNVLTRDGETIVIGGLIRDEDIRSVTEIPILSQLPIVGELFRTKSKERHRKEVLLFITTHIAKDDDPNPDPFGPSHTPEKKVESTKKP